MFDLNRNSQQPLYEQLAELIQTEITSGIRKPGERIESMREMAKRYNVSLFTVQRTISGLTRKGLLRPEKGNGTFVASKTPVKDCEVSNSTIAFLSAYGVDTLQSTPFFERLLQGFFLAASNKGKDLLCIAPQTKGKRPQPMDIINIRKRSACGIIVLCYDYPYLLSLRNLNLPVIVADMDMSHAGLDSAIFDNIDAAYQITKLAIADGSQHFCYIPFGRKNENGIYEDSHDPAIWERFSGIKKAICEAGLADGKIPVINWDSTDPEEVVRVAEEFEKLSPRPDAIISHSDCMTLAFAKELEKRGIEVKKEITLCGFGMTNLDDLDKGYKFIRTKSDETTMAQECVDLLLRRIREPLADPLRKLIPMEIVK